MWNCIYSSVKLNRPLLEIDRTTNIFLTLVSIVVGNDIFFNIGLNVLLKFCPLETSNMSEIVYEHIIIKVRIHINRN